MWFSFWRSRDRFSLSELRYWTDQLEKVPIVSEVNKDFVIEALRSIAELITYGDQHDANFFEYFMEKQVMGEFVRILKISRPVTVSLQLLQTMSIMIQNLKSEHAIYYMFSNEHINYLITYSFDFCNEELLSYYISFLRAISGKLNKNTISLLVKTQNEEVVSFPLYVEAIRFAFHEESMIRTAVCALTLNVYHVGDESVNRFVANAPHSDYFSNLVTFFRKQCIDLNGLVSETLKNRNSNTMSRILSAVDEIEDKLYYLSDVISAGIPDVGRLIIDNMLQFLILPLLLPSLQSDAVNEIQFDASTSLYLLCCILRIVKTKDLANTMAVALFFPPTVFIPKSEAKLNGHVFDHGNTIENLRLEGDAVTEFDTSCLKVTLPNCSSSSLVKPEDVATQNHSVSHRTLRDALLSYITNGDDLQVLGSLSVLATMLQTKELDETMLDALGILPQRKQHKKLLLQALVGEASGEDQLFASELSSSRYPFSSELDGYLQKLKELYGGLCYLPEVGTSPRVYRYQVLDSLVILFGRSDVSTETLWDGGWLLRQLLPYSEVGFNNQHMKLLKDSYKNCTSAVVEEARGIWPDLLLAVVCDEWKKCKRAIEASCLRKEAKNILLPLQKSSCDDLLPGESSIIAGERMCELVKVFVLLHQLEIFSLGRALPEQPPLYPPMGVPENSRSRIAGLDLSGPKPGAELRLVDAVPCRIAFERGKERHFYFLAVSIGTSGWILLIEELPLKHQSGVVRLIAPLAGSNPRIDDKHPRWLHLRIRPSSLPLIDPNKYATNSRKTKALVDGRWTLAFRNEESCKIALSMVLEEINLQGDEVERRLKPLLDFDIDIQGTIDTCHCSLASSATPSN